MSDVFLLHADADNFAAVGPADPAAFDLFDRFDGRPLGDEWEPVLMESLPTGPRGDFPHLASNVPVITGRAWETLGPHIGEAVEALPVDAQGEQFFALNVLTVLDCVDPERAEFRVLEGTIVGVRRWALRKDVVRGHDIFKARHAELQAVLVSQQFKEWVETGGLRGAVFETVPD
jgi:hypothetical protein